MLFAQNVEEAVLESQVYEPKSSLTMIWVHKPAKPYQFRREQFGSKLDADAQ